MCLEELRRLISKKENERVEFKEWKESFSILGDGKFENRKCLLGYCVALGNEGGGYLLIGVTNTGELIGTKADMRDAQKQIFGFTGQKITVNEVLDEKGRRILVVKIPSRGVGELFRYAGVPLMRVNDSLEVMTESEQKRIILEGQDDFSSRICKEAEFSSLDSLAISELRRRYSEKYPGNKNILSFSDEQLLRDMELIRGSGVTWAAIILLGKKSFIKQYLPQSEICFEYRNNENDIQAVERIDYRAPFLSIYDDIWMKIESRKQIHQFQMGLIRRDIPAYDEEVIREALLNAVAHRDYSDTASVYIKQSPQALEISNPGGFLPGITPDNIVFVQSKPRNRLIAEVMQKIGLIERSGQGADKIFRRTIEDGKGLPDYSRSTEHSVDLIIPAILRDQNFIKYLEKITNERQTTLSMEDLLLLEKIRDGISEGVTTKTIKHLLHQGFIEMHGRTRGAQYILSRRYYSETGKLGERTRRIGLSREAKKELILSHIARNDKGKMSEFLQLFTDMKQGEISRLLKELKESGKIFPEGSRRWAVWKIKDSK